MESRTARITKRTVDAVVTPTTEAGEARVWDTDLKGFFLRVYPSGRRVYALKYRLGPLQRIFTIGVHGSPYTPEMARDAADAALRRVADGEDPATIKKEAREALTVSALINRYLEDGPATKPSKRASTWANDGSNLKRHILPLLGRKVANAVSKARFIYRGGRYRHRRRSVARAPRRRAFRSCITSGRGWPAWKASTRRPTIWRRAS